MEKALLTEFTEDKETILEIAEVAKAILKREHNIAISNQEAIPTIVDSFLQAAVGYLSQHKSKDKEVSIDILGYIGIGVSYEEFGEDSDKTGNFAPTVLAGEIFRKAVKDDLLTENETDNEEEE